ncbi:hypothetical protein D3C76_1686390 [compost metagenome]
MITATMDSKVRYIKWLSPMVFSQDTFRILKKINWASPLAGPEVLGYGENLTVVLEVHTPVTR